MSSGYRKGEPASEKRHVAKQIIDKAIGKEACYESHIRLARRYPLDRLKDILFLLESFEGVE